MIFEQPTGRNDSLRRVLYRWCAIIVLAGAIIAGVPGSSSAQPVNSTLTGRIVIDVKNDATYANTSASSPIPTMRFTFDGPPYEGVSADLIPFTRSVVTTIIGLDEGNGWYRDTCLDTQTFSSIQISSGIFEPVSGHIDYLRLTFVIHHSLSRTFGSGPFADLGCPGTNIPDELFEVTLSTRANGGAALDATGNITLFGTSTSASGNPVDITVAGTLSPQPRRTPACAGVIVPDVTGSPNLRNARRAVEDAGLIPVFHYPSGRVPANVFINRQDPGPDECVAPGTEVHLWVLWGLVP